MPRFNVLSTTLGLAATLAMAASPAVAAELPVSPLRGAQPAASVFDADAVNADGWRRHRYRDRVDAGDVLAGVLIIGGIAAVASAASNSSRNREYRDDRYRNDYRTRSRDDSYQYRRDNRSNAGSGIDNAVNRCVGEIERDVRVATVDGVDRDAAGWLVTGTIYNGDGFSCRIDGSGRVDGINYGRGGAVSYGGAAQDNQWDDERYRAAWAQVDTTRPGTPAPASDGPQPAYPGGPLPGEEASAD